jgi:hypothetical protein
MGLHPRSAFQNSSSLLPMCLPRVKIEYMALFLLLICGWLFLSYSSGGSSLLWTLQSTQHQLSQLCPLLHFPMLNETFHLGSLRRGKHAITLVVSLLALFDWSRRCINVHFISTKNLVLISCNKLKHQFITVHPMFVKLLFYCEVLGIKLWVSCLLMLYHLSHAPITLLFGLFFRSDLTLLPQLVLDHDPLMYTLLVAGIIDVCHYTHFQFVLLKVDFAWGCTMCNEILLATIPQR